MARDGSGRFNWARLPLIATVARVLCREVTLENEYLGVQYEVVRSEVPGRIRFIDDERWSLMKAALAMGRKAMRSVVSIVKPETILAWPRRLEQKKWDYSGASLKYFGLLRELGHTQEIRVWIGNSGHSRMSPSGSIRWLDWVIKGKDTGIKDRPPVRVFVQGINRELYFDRWPPAGMRNARCYLRGPDGGRKGALSTEPPGREPPTRFRYDPRNPVPSIGGNANHRGVRKTLSSGAVLQEGSLDQRRVESRQDVLVFTTPVPAEDVTVIGPVSLKLFAATDARDTDFTAVLIDVQPDGRAMNVTEGIVRARFHDAERPSHIVLPVLNSTRD